MEEIYMNVAPNKSVGSRASTDPTERRLYGAVVLCLGLLSVLLLAGLIGLGVHYYDSSRRSASELSSIKANLTERLQVSYNKSSALTEERDQLNVSLIEMTKERNWLKRRCPAGWMVFGCSCYFLSNKSHSWDEARKDCKERGADLVVIDSDKEQLFLSNFTEKGTHAWIGLTDEAKEGTWKWINGAPLSLKYWQKNQPDNGGGYANLGEEDCAHVIKSGENNRENWNDLSCFTSQRWICEKMFEIKDL
uniref:CD209 antigen-like protein C n=1 Tax=Epinephelus lanceolatus TaxID=310571 RepID=UPI00144791D2|nr:CD209 antigen-like protein C [Epinephelus lanceolatus]